MRLQFFQQVCRLATASSEPLKLRLSKIGIVGLGTVGKNVARNLQRHGYPLMAVHDQSPAVMDRLLDKNKDKVQFCSTPRELAHTCDVIITCLPAPKDVKKVFSGESGILNGIQPNSLWVDHTTTDYHQTLRLTKDVEDRGAHALEAPLSGGITLLEQGQMSAYTGGKEEVHNQALHVLKPSIRHVVYMGKMGNATILKIISNMLAGAHQIVMGEALLLAKRNGLDLNQFFNGIRVGAGNSFVFETEAPTVFNGTYDTKFAIELHCKDLKLGRELAEQSNTTLPIHTLVESIYRETMYKYGKDVPSAYPTKMMEEEHQTSLQTPGYADWLYSGDSVQEGNMAVVHTTAAQILKNDKK